MNKMEIISRYGKTYYEARLKYQREYRTEHLEEEMKRCQEWAKSNPDKVKANVRERNCKTGKYYNRRMAYEKKRIASSKKYS